MSYRARRRLLKVSPKVLPLAVGVALGLWLGFIAISLTLWGVWQFVPEVREPVAAVISQPLTPPAPAQPPAARRPGAEEQSTEQNRMFEQYQQSLQSQQIEDAVDSAEQNPRNLSNAKCQFWLQQNRTAPTEKSRANVLEFCR